MASQAIWGDKNNYYLAHIGTLKALFPRARFLHIVRDGRDVACSYREVMSTASDSPYKPDLPVAIGAIASRWATDIRSIREQFALLPPAGLCEIRYEDLTADATGELMRICAWLDVPFSSQMLAFHDANRRQRLEPAATMGWKQRTLQPASRDTVGRHARMLEPAEAAAFVSIAGDELRHYRYIQ